MIIREKDPDVVVSNTGMDSTTTNTIIAVVVIAILGLAIYFFSVNNTDRVVDTTTIQTQPAPASTTIINNPASPAAIPEVPMAPQPTTVTVPVPVPTTTNIHVTNPPAPAAPAPSSSSSTTETKTDTLPAPAVPEPAPSTP